MPQYSDESDSESESDCEVEVVLKSLPKAEVVAKTKRAYTRKLPVTGESKSRTAEKPVAEKKVKDKKQTVTEVHHHYHQEQEDKPVRQKKQPPQEIYTPKIPQMMFA